MTIHLKEYTLEGVSSDVKVKVGRLAGPEKCSIQPILTGKIVLAHLREIMGCYARIGSAEMEGDLLKVILSRNIEKRESRHGKRIEAQIPEYLFRTTKEYRRGKMPAR